MSRDIEKQREAKRRHYQKNKQVYFDKNKKVVEAKREFIKQIKSVPCMDCGNRFPPCVMDFDHRNPKDKINNVGNLTAFGWQKIKDEIAKCDIICANCHRIRTWLHSRVV